MIVRENIFSIPWRTVEPGTLWLYRTRYGPAPLPSHPIPRFASSTLVLANSPSPYHMGVRQVTVVMTFQNGDYDVLSYNVGDESPFNVAGTEDHVVFMP